MSGKHDKKLRQIYRRDYRSLAEIMAADGAKIIKRKPKYAPEWLWIFLLGFFVRINK